MSDRLTDTELRWHIITPSGSPVPGMSGSDAGLLWNRYARVMRMTRQELENAGYRAATMPIRVRRTR